jgi:hypothetical protein
MRPPEIISSPNSDLTSYLGPLMKISTLAIYPENGLETIKNLYNPNLEWDVFFNIPLLQGFMRQYDNMYTDVHGHTHHLPISSFNIVESITPFREVSVGDDPSLWGYFMGKIKQHHGYGKWMCLSFLSKLGFACNSQPIIHFLDRLDGAETAAMVTLLHSKDYLFEEPYISIVKDALPSLIDKLIQFTKIAANEPEALFEASAHYALMMTEATEQMTTVVKGKTFGLGLHMLDSLHPNQLVNLVINSLNTNPRHFTEHVSRLYENADLKSTITANGYRVKNTTFQEVESSFRQSYDNASSDEEIIQFVRKYSFISSEAELTMAECHQISAINDIIEGIDPSILEKSNPISLFQLYDPKKPINKEHVDQFINLWKDEIVEASALRRIYPVHSPSVFSYMLKQALKKRSDDNFCFYSKQSKETVKNLLDYATLRCGLLAHNHLMEQDLSVLPDDHHQFIENYDSEHIGQFIQKSGIDPQYIDHPEKIISLFAQLPVEDQGIDNKLFCGITLTEEELRTATPKQKRLQISYDMDI